MMVTSPVSRAMATFSVKESSMVRGAFTYGKIIEAAAGDPDIWIGTRAQIARHVLAGEAS